MSVVTPARDAIRSLRHRLHRRALNRYRTATALVLMLFCDASRVGMRELRADLGCTRGYWGSGLPLTIGLGTLLALALPGVTDVWFALLVGAALALTDAALGAGWPGLQLQVDVDDHVSLPLKSAAPNDPTTVVSGRGMACRAGRGRRAR